MATIIVAVKVKRRHVEFLQCGLELRGFHPLDKGGLQFCYDVRWKTSRPEDALGDVPRKVIPKLNEVGYVRGMRRPCPPVCDEKSHLA